MTASNDPTALSLQPLRRTTLAEGVAQQILGQLQENAVEPGTRLPSERELMQRLGVGRSTVREALNGLATLGVIEIRHGQGAYVAHPPDDDDIAGIVGALVSCRTRDIFEARRTIEPRIAELAAERREPAELSELDQVLDAHAEAIERGGSTLRPSSDFHMRLADAAHSEAMASCVKSLIKVLEERTPELELVEGYPEWELSQHRGLCRAVRDGDGAAAAALMSAHIDAVASYHARIEAGEAGAPVPR